MDSVLRKVWMLAIAILLICGMISSAEQSFADNDENAGGITYTVKKTNIEAESVFNTGGYASITAYPKYCTAKQLVDRNGTVIMPMTDGWSSYRVDNGIISLTESMRSEIGVDGDHPGFGTHYYRLSGTQAEEIKTPLLSGSPMFEGYATGYIYNGKENYRTAVIIDSTGSIVYTFPKEFDVNISYDSAWGQDLNSGEEIICGQEIFDDGDYWIGWCTEGLIACWNVKRDDEGYYYDPDYDEDRYVDKYDFYDGDYVIYNVAYYDITGKKIIDLPGYENASAFHEGMAGVKKNGKWGYIDKTGTVVIPCQYEGYNWFMDGLAAVCKDDKWGYINKAGETVIPFSYDDAYGAGCGLAAVVKDDKCGLVDYNNNVVVPFEYDDLSSVEDGVAYGVKDGKLYILTFGGSSDPDPDKEAQQRAEAVTEAENKITETDALKQEDYTELSYNAVITAKTKLQKLLAAPDSTSAEIRAAMEELSRAISGLQIEKKKNTMTVKAKSVSLKASVLKKKDQKIKKSKAFTVSKNQGKVTFKMSKIKKDLKKKITISKSGVITVKKGLKKGKYQFNVAVTAAGNESYKLFTKTVKVTINVK